MLAESGRPFDSKDHIFEIKWDGIRCLAFLDPDSDSTYLQSRNLLNLNPHYPDLSTLHHQAHKGACVIDGEIIALRNGRPSFLDLQQRMNASGLSLARLTKRIPVLFVAFDIPQSGIRMSTAGPGSPPPITRRTDLSQVSSLSSRKPFPRLGRPFTGPPASRNSKESWQNALARHTCQANVRPTGSK